RLSLNGAEWAGRQSFYPPAVGAASPRRPAVERHRRRHPGSVGPGSTHPQVVLGCRLRRDFFKGKRLAGPRVLAVGWPGEDAWQGQGGVARLGGVAEGLPCGVPRAGEDGEEVVRPAHLGEVLDAVHSWGGGGHERRLRRSRQPREALKQRDILGRGVELVIADEQPEWLVDEQADRFSGELTGSLREEGPIRQALVEVTRGQVLPKLFLADVEHPNLEVLAGLGVLHQVVQTEPSRLQTAEL